MAVRVQTVAELIFNSYQTTEPLVEIIVSGIFSLTPKQFVPQCVIQLNHTIMMLEI